MTSFTLDPIEARLLGVLIEKALTTPENYPLSLNAVTNGANQKSNRDPVLELLESEVRLGLQGLTSKNLVYASHSTGSRVEKFRHNGEAILELDTPRLAVLAELLMRGPQTPGELRVRVSRMTPLDDLGRLMELLRPLLERGLVQRLSPAPGSRAERYAQTLAPKAHPEEASAHAATTSRPVQRVAPATFAPPAAARPAEPVAPAPTGALFAGATGPSASDAKLEKRVEELEHEVTRLRRQLRNLAWKLGQKLEG